MSEQNSKQVQVQVQLRGEEAELWKRVKNKKTFIEVFLQRAYKDPATRDMFFSNEPFLKDINKIVKNENEPLVNEYPKVKIIKKSKEEW